MLQQARALAALPHAAGNNYRAVRQRRVNVNFQLQSNSRQPRWYFPDIPDLNDKLIVGIEAHCADGFEELDFDIQVTVAPNGFTYWTAYDARFCFVNLIDNNKAQIIQNFPGYMFYNAETSGNTFGTKTGKIMPVFAYLLIRECFLFFPDSYTPNRDKTASFTFYHYD